MKKRPGEPGSHLLSKDVGQVNVEVALQYTTGYVETVFSYCNNIHTGRGAPT